MAMKPDRALSLGAALAVQGALLSVLIWGLGTEPLRQATESLKLFDIEVPPDPPPVAEPPTPSKAEQGEAAPPNLEAQPAPVVAPPPRVPIERPPPVTAAPVASTADQPRAGASDRPGPGTGAGGQGTGIGSGGSGTGTGSGIVSRARKVAGEIEDDDYPRRAERARIGGTVIVRLSVGADGGVSDCQVTISSGNIELDSTTCRLIRERFRYEPARDSRGRAVPDVTGWRQVWWFER